MLPLLAVAAYGFLRRRLWQQRGVAVLLTLAAILMLLHALIAGKYSGFYQLYPTTLLLALAAIGERRATTLKKKRHPDIRIRYNGLLWLEGGVERQVHWTNDD